jgi:hypothetical protein
MWTRPFAVGVSETVPAAPERVWSLLASSAALSARPGGFCFDTPPTSDAGRPLRLYLHADRAGVQILLLEVTEQSGDLIRLQRTDGRVGWELSVEPSRHGSRIRLVTSFVVGRDLKVHYQATERARLRSWARNLRAIYAGERPWPDGSMPDDVRQACLLERTGRDSVEVTAQARVERPADAVMRMMLAPEVVYAVSPGLVHFGPVPSSPASGPGRMTYRITNRADRLRATAAVTTEQQGDVMVVRNLASPYSPARFRVRPDGPAATLSLEFWCRNKPRVQSEAEHFALHEEQTKRLAAAYKTAIEQAVPPAADG